MKKNDYITIISEKYNYPKTEINNIINSYIELLKEDIINKDKVSITNFGTFTKTKVKSKVQYSPIDGDTLNNEYVRITFKKSRNFNDKINK